MEKDKEEKFRVYSLFLLDLSQTYNLLLLIRGVGDTEVREFSLKLQEMCLI